MHRGDGDEPPVPALPQRGPRVLREEKRARHEQGDELVPLLLRKLLDRSDVLEAGVRDDRVEPAEALERRVDDHAVAFARRQVRVGEVDAVHRPVVPLQPLDDRRADAACRARDERDLHAIGPHRTTLAAQV